MKGQGMSRGWKRNWFRATTRGTRRSSVMLLSSMLLCIANRFFDWMITGLRKTKKPRIWFPGYLQLLTRRISTCAVVARSIFGLITLKTTYC